MKKIIIAGLVLILGVATVATTVSATSQPEQRYLTWGLHYSEASTTSIPKEEAQQIGINALTDFFGADLSQLGEYILEMNYTPSVLHSLCSPPVASGRSMWHGTIRVPNDRQPCPDGLMLRSNDLFRFRVDGKTGELIGLQFFPSECPIARPDIQSDCMGSPAQIIEYRDNMTTRHNIEYANHAIQFAEQANIFEGEILRATTIAGGWMMGRGETFELAVAVAIESATGETATLIFQGQNRKELIDIDFSAVNPEIANWIYR